MQIPDVLNEMASLWNIRSGRPDSAIANHADDRRNTSLKAADVRQALTARFDEKELRDQILRFLAHLCDVYERDQAPPRPERHICDCALAMGTEEGGVKLPLELAQRIVRAFPPAIWHFPIGKLISRYLTFSQLLESLLNGIVNPPHPAAMEDCLTGFRLYLGRAKPDEGPQRKRLLDSVLKELEKLARSDDPEIIRLAENARQSLQHYQS
jgi:hypothetical protein